MMQIPNATSAKERVVLFYVCRLLVFGHGVAIEVGVAHKNIYLILK
jgi:hypothetical protein